jgi:hypothetical protein
MALWQIWMDRLALVRQDPRAGQEGQGRRFPGAEAGTHELSTGNMF